MGSDDVIIQVLVVINLNERGIVQKIPLLLVCTQSLAIVCFIHLEVIMCPRRVCLGSPSRYLPISVAEPEKIELGLV